MVWSIPKRDPWEKGRWRFRWRSFDLLIRDDEGAWHQSHSAVGPVVLGMTRKTTAEGLERELLNRVRMYGVIAHGLDVAWLFGLFPLWLCPLLVVAGLYALLEGSDVGRGVVALLVGVLAVVLLVALLEMGTAKTSAKAFLEFGRCGACGHALPRDVEEETGLRRCGECGAGWSEKAVEPPSH